MRRQIQRDPESVIDLIYQLFDTIEALSARVKHLEDQLGKTSANSSKPPSSDGFSKFGQKAGRSASRRKAGGQAGHRFHSLKPSANPTERIFHPISRCACGCDLSNIQKTLERRQIFDIPEIKMQVTEHVFEVASCPACGVNAAALQLSDFPRPAQYGNRIRSFCLYLMQYQLLPYERTHEFCRDIFQTNLSVGTLHNWAKLAYKNLEIPDKRKRGLICQQPVIHCDETGVNINGKLHWLHVCSTDTMTVLHVHQNRGLKAMTEIGILPEYKGVAVHDYWRPYYRTGTSHALCNAHLLRELKFLSEQHDQKWAKQSAKLLVDIKDAVATQKEYGNTRLAKSDEARFLRRYVDILHRGEANQPADNPVKVKRGRPKRTPAKNLLMRMTDRREDILRFMSDFRVPFDNNQAERDFRMVKVQQKISGCFRSYMGAKIFARVRGYISSAKKNGVNVLQAIESVVAGAVNSPFFAE